MFAGMIEVDDRDGLRKVHLSQVFHPFRTVSQNDDLLDPEKAPMAGFAIDPPPKLVESGSRIGDPSSEVAVWVNTQPSLASRVFAVPSGCLPLTPVNSWHVMSFDKAVWAAEPVKDAGGASVRFSYLSVDGKEGYPGNLKAVVTYTLTNEDELKIAYEAEADAPTPVNLTHHNYFNLAGQGDILGHVLTLEADKYALVGDTLIPTGELREVKGTPMDFTASAAIGLRIAEVKGGYDHNYVLRSGGGSLTPAATVYEPGTARVMEISTTEPDRP